MEEAEEPRPKTGEEDYGNATVDFHGEKRSNQSHPSTTDPEVL
jgi:hypothetical protein